MLKLQISSTLKRANNKINARPLQRSKRWSNNLWESRLKAAIPAHMLIRYLA